MRPRLASPDLPRGAARQARRTTSGPPGPRGAHPSTICRVLKVEPQVILRARRGRLAAAVTALMLTLAILAGCGGSGSTEAAVVPLSSVKDYQAIPDRPLGPATQTVAQAAGGTWSYSHPEPGHLTLLYFGYTDCPDICPLTMSDLAVAVRKLPASLQDKVWVQFVSTDPHRDTPARLHRWIDSYSPRFHAGRAPIDQVIAAAKSYAISISKPKVTKGDYQVTHGADVLVLDQQGGEVGFFTELAGWHSYADALPSLIKDFT